MQRVLRDELPGLAAVGRAEHPVRAERVAVLPVEEVDEAAAGDLGRRPATAAVARAVDGVIRCADPAVPAVDELDLGDVGDRIAPPARHAAPAEIREPRVPPRPAAVRREPEAAAVDRPGDARRAADVPDPSSACQSATPAIDGASVLAGDARGRSAAPGQHGPDREPEPDGSQDPGGE